MKNPVIVPLAAAPEMLAAVSTSRRLRDELVAVDTQIAKMQAEHQRAQQAARDPVADALALVDGERQEPQASAELRRLIDRRAAVAAGADVADVRQQLVRAELSRAYMTNQLPQIIAALNTLGAGFAAVQDAGKAFEIIRDEATRLGYDYTAGSLPVDLGQGHDEFVAARLRLVRGLAEELADRLATDDGPVVRVRALADIDGAVAGEVKTLPGKLARLLARLGRVEVETPAERLKKAVTA